MKQQDIAAMVSVNKSVYRPGPIPTKMPEPSSVKLLGIDSEVVFAQKKKLRNQKQVTSHTIELSDKTTHVWLSDKNAIEIEALAQFVKREFSGNPHVICYTLKPEQIMSALNVHSLDERLEFIGSSAGSFHICWKEEDFTLEILDLSAFFPHVEYKKILATFSTPLLGVSRETLHVATKLRELVLEDFGLDIARFKTPGMLAAKIFTTQYLAEPVGMVRKAIRHQGMLSYWAGNNQAFGRGEFVDDLRMYDAVSMYPSSCIEIGILPHADNWYRMIESDIQTCIGGVLRVEFSFPEDELYPCLPVPSFDSLVFPLSGVSDCTVWEVLYALEIGCRIKLLSGWAYKTGSTFLPDYSRRLLELKKLAESLEHYPRRELYKILANSVFGKLAQKRLEETLEDKRTIAAALGYRSIAEMHQTDNWQYQAEQMLGAPVPLRATVGGLWCPEWAALINGYARAVEARAMRENSAFLGTTDNVIINKLPDDPEEFYVMGIRYVLKKRIAVLKIIRSRLYVYLTEDGELDGALHGFPASSEMLEAVFEWNGQDFYPIYRVPALTKLRHGLITGDGAGRPYIRKWKVSFDRDKKRLPAGNFSMPLPFVDQML